MSCPLGLPVTRYCGYMTQCAKFRYRDRVSALLALSETGRKDSRRPKDEKRAYECPACKGWHLTSVPLHGKAV